MEKSKSYRLRVAAYFTVAAGVFGLAGYMLFHIFARSGLPPIPGNTIDISADMSGFSRSVIRIKAGQPVTVRLRSLDGSHHTDGGGRHQWAVDELGVDIIAPPEGSSYKTFVADKPGTYTFYCDICCGGRANPSMSGRLVVS